MKLSVTVTPAAPPGAPVLLRGDLGTNIALAAELGFDGVELHLPRADDVDGPALLEACRAAGIAVSTIGTGGIFTRDGLQLITGDREVRELCMTRLREFIELGKVLQAAVIIGSARGSIPRPDRTAFYERHFFEVLGRLAEYAGEKGVTLLLEAINRYETNYLNSAEEVQALVAGAGSPNLMALLDTFHMNIEEVSPADSIRRCGPALGHLHFADSNRRFPGAGHYPFTETIQALADIGYSRWIALEYLPLPDAVTAAREGLFRVREMAARAGKGQQE